MLLLSRVFFFLNNGDVSVKDSAYSYNLSFKFDHIYIIGGVTHHYTLPHLPGVSHLHVKRPSVSGHFLVFGGWPLNEDSIVRAQYK